MGGVLKRGDSGAYAWMGGVLKREDSGAYGWEEFIGGELMDGRSLWMGGV